MGGAGQRTRGSGRLPRRRVRAAVTTRPATEPVGLPRWLLVPAAAGVLLVAVPVVGLLLRVPWAELPRLLGSEASLAALGLSLRTSVAATALATALGVPLALVLAGGPPPPGRLVRTGVPLAVV